LLTQNALQGVAPPFALCHGTTTLAFVFGGGIVAAADTRASAAGLICCPAAQKIQPVHAHLLMTTSGSAADCMLWERILSRQLRLYHLRHRHRLSVGGAAKLLSHMLHPYKGTDVCVAAMLCGWDGGRSERTDGGVDLGDLEGEREAGNKGGDRGRWEGWEREVETTGMEDITVRGRESEPIRKSRRETEPIRARGRENKPIRGPLGPGLYYVCSDGTRLQGELFSVGSGSPYAYSVLDGGVQWGLGVAEACALARRAVYHATHRDAYSGNCVDLYHITARGWSRRKREDLREEYYRERERERERVEERRREGEMVERRMDRKKERERKERGKDEQKNCRPIGDCL
ncbi:hypothetical protein JZ751_017229, partial [Albula glossodonta]